VPPQKELLDLYRASSPFVVTPNAKEQYKQRVHEDDFIGYIDRFVDPPRSVAYLEIGAGGGQMVREFRRRGHPAYGVEPAAWNPDDGIVETLHELPPGKRFGIIVLQDVLEHLFDPAEMLSELRAYAAPAARLFCSVPYSTSWPARRYLTRWNMVRPFGHLHYFSQQSAREVLSRSGWQLFDACPARAVPLPRLIAGFRFRAIAYQLLKGGKDQLYVCAIPQTL
jgi:SAM-dependent methyltransferase